MSTQPAAHYDRVHEAWRLIMGEEFHYGYFSSADTTLEVATAALTSEMLSRAGIGEGNRVLDVGCGTGRQSCDLAADLGASVLGITTSASGVAAASALARSRGVDARFEQRDGTANGLPDGSFDVVWALESSHLMRDRAGLLSESARVLAPGGRFVLCDIIRKREIPFLEVRSRRHDLAVLRSAFGDAHMEPLAAYASSLEDLGLEVLDATDISEPTLGTFAAWRANVAAHEATLLELLDRQSVDDFVRATEVLEAFWNDGTLGYGILAAVKP
ncbi:methyltransferase domain-containing protein [Nocardioides sp. JQ2195]|uniref:SAM-dependent methyltransferase n=1 Tax=Nocardioides sp. JQ2195 TaxID=2592334 RepID=UPI00143EC5ED|nr:methyltransferase domain-containing protein [Nocardioides sp. JQ2195]QIX25492.1 methyltransferase domain-containing protein [Nocardioides sp. JQ2195]